MKIAIAGAGAMGCRFGWMLKVAGNEVLLIDGWHEHVEAIQARGLEVVAEGGRRVSDMPVSLPLDSQGEADLLIVFTKAMQTEDMIQRCVHLLGECTWVLTLQNGLGNIETLEAYVRRDRILAGVTTFTSELLGPGRIQALGSGQTEIMRVEGAITEAVQRIAGVMNDAGLHAVISPNALVSIWTKLAFNCVLNPLCTLMYATVGAVGSYSGVMDMAARIVDEIVHVAQADNVMLERERILALIAGQFDPSMASHHLASMLQDMQNGRKTEIGQLNGAVVRKAEQHGIPVPHNRLICDLILMMEQTRAHRVS